MSSRTRLFKRAGFTLIELLVVVVIIGILASTAMPSFNRAQDMARNAAMKSNVKNVQIALETYSSDNHSRYPTSLADSTFLTAPYMPTGTLPRAPWSKLPQTGDGGVIGNLGLVTYWDDVKDWAADGIAQGSWAGINGIVVDSPSSYLHYGVLLYNYDNSANLYRLCGMGKSKKNIQPCSPVSNGAI